MNKRVGSSLLCLVLCLSLCACAAGEKKVQDDQTPTAPVTEQTAEPTVEPTPEVKDSYGVGEAAELDGVTVTLTQVEESNGAQFFEPEEGKVYLLCHFDIANDSDEDLSISSLLNFDAYVDDYAVSMSLGATTSSAESQLDGTVAAGKKMAGVIGYEVDASWNELEITFQPDAWSGEDLTFTAQHA